jgi:DNA-binding response OmpR family regulator
MEPMNKPNRRGENGPHALTKGPIERPHVLVVDDDPVMRRMIDAYLVEHNFRTSVAADRQAFAQIVGSKLPDLVVLDIHLGADDGLDLLRELRQDSVVPVIVITGRRRDEVDRVIGLELGADDYITKPFGLRELLARIRATLRRRRMDSLRPEQQGGRIYVFGRWTLDQRRRTLSDEVGEVTPLAKAEYALLCAFVAAPGRPLTREYLVQATRMHEDVFDRSIDVQILRLRRKLEENPRAPRLILTERGVGYWLDTEVHEA